MDAYLALAARSLERPLFVAALLVTADLSDVDVEMLVAAVLLHIALEEQRPCGIESVLERADVD